MFGKKVLLKWKEPRFAYKYARKQISWKQWLLNFCIYVATLTLIGLAIGFFVNLFSSEKVSYLDQRFLGFGEVGAFLGMFFWILGRLVDLRSPEISMLEKGISKYEPPDKYSSIAYQEIQSCSFVKNKIGEMEYDVLEIKIREDSEISIEIDPKINIENIAEILKSKNVQIKSSLLNPI